MSVSGINPDIEGDAPSVSLEPAESGRKWRVPEFRRLPVPALGTLIYAGIRLLNVALVAVAIQHGFYATRHRTLLHWFRSGDGGHYYAIAAHGYTYPAGDLAHAQVLSFFPGYPFLIDTLAWLPGITIVIGGMIVTAASGLAAAWGLTRLGLRLTGSPKMSLLLVAVWAVAPSSSVLSMMYAEALFIALAVWALVALTEQRWLTAAGFTAAAGLVRSTAVAVIAALAVAALIALVRAARDRQPLRSWWRPAAALVLAPLGLVAYLAYVAVVTHRLDGWFWIENHTFHMSFDWGISTLRVAKDTFMYTPAVSDVLVVLALGAAVVLTLWSLVERIPVYLHVYTLVVVFLAMSTSANWLGSKPRFILPAVLLALPVARLLAPLRAIVLVPLVLILVAASTWFSLYLLLVPGWAP
jgi:hypothetical protein